MKLVIGSDHGGYALKEDVKKTLMAMGVEFDDCGVYNEESADYPVIAKALCQSIVDGKYEKGILLCGTGIGVSIVSNRVKGIRAALCGDVFSAKMSREHNNANVLCMGGRVTGPGLADMIVRTWIETDFAGDRHLRRINMIDN